MQILFGELGQLKLIWSINAESLIDFLRPASISSLRLVYVPIKFKLTFSVKFLGVEFLGGLLVLNFGDF